jgi:hypothetical protein
MDWRRPAQYGRGSAIANPIARLRADWTHVCCQRNLNRLTTWRVLHTLRVQKFRTRCFGMSPRGEIAIPMTLNKREPCCPVKLNSAQKTGLNWQAKCLPSFCGNCSNLFVGRGARTFLTT